MNPANGVKFSIEELKMIVGPIAKEYGVKKVYLFGSMARGDFNEESDYDICIDRGKIDCIFRLSAFSRDLRNAIGDDVDVVTTKGAERRPEILKTIMDEGIVIYG
ncbi:MAG: nucleotidyltransferase domain-containing protein [Methanomassiliicoccaceae archaeon]|nr:nucleotidyltransferase domain-containing protein [Methanomassiliicoccaceae archaeon]